MVAATTRRRSTCTQLEKSLSSSIGGSGGGTSSFGSAAPSGPAFTDVKVDCPDDVEQKAGVAFECGVSAIAGPSAPQPGDAAKGQATVTQGDDEGMKFKTTTKIEGGGTTSESTSDLTISTSK